jgi:hypothetical protein
MQLTLRYKDELPASSGSNSRVPEKHEIRKQLHHQLAVFWSQHAVLKPMNADLKSLQVARRFGGKFDVQRPIVGLKNFWWRYPLCGINFVPLVTDVQEAHCRLDIRIYRRVDAGGFLFEGGDLDNRLKTFFDALRVPHSRDQLPSEIGCPDVDETAVDWPPLFCLLDDDRAITKLSIESLNMLTPVPGDCGHPENYVELEMDVKVIPVTPMSGTLNLLF